MSELDPKRIALIVAKPGRRGAQTGDSVSTGYFLTGDLVLTAGHVADRPDWNIRVRAEIDPPEKDQWSHAKPLWIGDVDVDAMLLPQTASSGSGSRRCSIRTKTAGPGSRLQASRGSGRPGQ